MLEGVDDLGKQAFLEHQIAGAKRVQSVTELLLGEPGDLSQKRLGEALANDRRGLEQQALALRQAVDARGEQRLDRRRNAQRGNRPETAVGAPLALEPARLYERLDDLLDEERIAARALAHEITYLPQAGVTAEELVERTFARCRP